MQKNGPKGEFVETPQKNPRAPLPSLDALAASSTGVYLGKAGSSWASVSASPAAEAQS